MITPRNPKTSASSPDDDPTGVRALLSALPEPEPMPAYLVERISASLAAEQAERAVSFTGASVTPLLDPKRRRPGRLLFAIAGAAAAVALIGVVGSSLLRTNPTTTASHDTAAAITSDGRGAEGAAPPSTYGPSANDKAAAGSPSASVIQIGASQTRYTQADFVAQARTLRRSLLPPQAQLSPGTADSSTVGRIGTKVGLSDCLMAIGAGGAQVVRADLAFYEGQPAVVIVTTTNGVPTAYAVGRTCSAANPALLHPAVALP